MLASSSWNMSVMNYVKILNSCVYSKLDLATLVWLLECISRAALEEEIDNLKKKLAACTRENSNLQEELSEAYRIKSQLADLHGAEVLKNIEAEKQVKFFHGCVAAAFAERDHAMMEAEKAKEKEELLAHKINELPKRVDELTSECLEQKLLNDTLRIDLEKQEEQNTTFRKVINKFYEIKQHALEGLEDMTWDDKCACLLHDPADMWSFSDDRETSTSKYISALEEELEKVRRSMDSLQNKLRMGLEIENHLKKKVYGLEKKNILCDKMIKNGVSELVHSHYQHRLQIMNLLDEEKSHLRSIVDTVEEKFRKFDRCRKQNLVSPQGNVEPDENECRDVHITNVADSNLVSEVNGPSLPEKSADGTGDASKALAQALHEKVATLLLLSQQEERHLLETHVNAALQKKVDELQRNLLQVTNEKVKALMEFAQLKQENQILREKFGNEMGQGKLLAVIGENRILTPERDGRLKNMLKKTYLRRWIGTLDSFGNDADAHPNEGGISSRQSNTSIDFARLKIENATLKESMESMEHLTSSIHRMRLSLVKVKESGISEGAISSMSEALDEIITDAKLVKTALGSSLPVSWSAEAEVETLSEGVGFEPVDVTGDHDSEKIDSVCAAGFEMVELLILAAQILKETTSKRDSGDAT